jgi:hypothetical protein
VAVGHLGADEDDVHDRKEAAGEAHKALASFDRLGARPLADRARRLLRALGERSTPPHRAVTGDLSDRELPVVRGRRRASLTGRSARLHQSKDCHNTPAARPSAARLTRVQH